MSESLKIALETSSDPDETILDPIGKLLREHNQSKVGNYDAQRFVVRALDDEGKLAGGLFGWFQWGWLYVDWLIVQPELRGAGIGRKLIASAEEFARTRGVLRSRLQTASFQGAVEFYKHLGYEVHATTDITAPDGSVHVDYSLRKKL